MQSNASQRTRPLGRPAVIPAQAATVLLILVVVSVGPIPVLVAARLSWLASVTFSVGTLIAAQAVARRLPPGDPARRFWWAICVNAVTSGLGYLVQLGLAGGPDDLITLPTPSLIIGLGAAGLVAVLCTYPLRIRSGRERACFWLDMATVMVGATSFAWYFAVAQRPGPPDLVAVLTGPVVMLVAVFAVAKLIIAGRPPFGLWTGLLGGAAAVVGGVTGVWGGSMVSAGAGRWMLALSAFGDALMMLGIWVQLLRADAGPATLDRPRRRPYSVLPYLALASTFVLLAMALREDGLDGQTMAVLIAAALSTALVVVRQIASFADNARLLSELDATVAELRQTEVGLRTAIAERDHLAVSLHRMAYRDSLTGLGNRALFHDRLAAALERGRRDGHPVAVLLFDLDEFKPINDRFGHATGDAVLQEVARRLRRGRRDGDTVARLGGDEFAILLDNPRVTDIPAIAERITAAVREPCVVADAPVTVGISVGTAIGWPGEYDADRLLNEADARMYAVKSGGGRARQMHRTRR